MGGMLATMACIALSSSPRLEQSMVNAELPSAIVSWQLATARRNGADGHLHCNAVSDVNGVAAVSLHCAFTTNASRVGSEMSQAAAIATSRRSTVERS